MEQQTVSPAPKKFAGIEVAPDLSRVNFFFLYLNTLFVGMLMVMPAIIQPAFLKDVINVSPDFYGYVNGFLQNMSQIATLAFVGLVGVLSDKFGRKILAIIGFITLIVFYYLFGQSPEIAAALNISPAFAAKVCALLNFAPGRAQEFLPFAPGLFTAYLLRLIVGIGLILVYPQFITMVADYTFEKDRGKGMALNGMMMGLASILIFTAVAPLGEKTGVAGLFVFASVMSFVGLVATTLFLKERMPETTSREKKDIKAIFHMVKKSPALKTSYLCSLIGRADITVMATFIIAWAVQHGEKIQLLSVEATKKGAIPMAILSVVTAVSFPICGILLDKWGRMATLLVTVTCAGVGLLIIAVSPSPFSGMVYGAVILLGFGLSGSIAGANTLATDASPKELVGSLLGGLNTMQPIGMLFFLQVGGYLYDVLGPGWAFGLKGAADILLAVWLLIMKNRVNDEIVRK